MERVPACLSGLVAYKRIVEDKFAPSSVLASYRT